MVLSKRLLTLIFSGILVSHTLSSQVLLVEDFSSASGHTPPVGWQTVLSAGVNPDDLWSFSDPYVVEPLASASGGTFATFPGFFYSENAREERAALISPWVKVPNKDKPLNLSFYHYYFISEKRGGWSISVRKNIASAWHSVGGVVEGELEDLLELAVIDVSSIVGPVDSIQVKFEGYGEGGLAWIVDDITLAQGTLQPIEVIHQPKLSTCSLSPVIEAITPDFQRVGKAWVIYSVDGIPQDPVNMTIGTKLSAMLTIDKPSTVEYQIVVEDTSPNRNRGYSPIGLDKRHRLIVGSTPSSEMGGYWDAGIRMYTSTEESIVNYFESSQLSFPLYSMDSTSDAINIITYPLQVEEGFDYLMFRRAYSGYGDISDTLRWYLSTDGNSWTSPLYEASGTRLRTAPAQPTVFTPMRDSHWANDGFTLSPWVNQCIQLRIEAAPGYGNNLYLDSLHFTESPELAVSIQDVYPNPSNDVVNVTAYIPPTGPAKLNLVSTNGQLIYSLSIDEPHGWFTTLLDVAALRAGLYALTLHTNGKVSSVLIMVQ